MSDDESLVSELALMVAEGELSATAYFAVVDERAEEWVNDTLLRAFDERLTLRHPDVMWLLVGVIAVLFLAGLVVALS